MNCFQFENDLVTYIIQTTIVTTKGDKQKSKPTYSKVNFFTFITVRFCLQLQDQKCNSKILFTLTDWLTTWSTNFKIWSRGGWLLLRRLETLRMGVENYSNHFFFCWKCLTFTFYFLFTRNYSCCCRVLIIISIVLNKTEKKDFAIFFPSKLTSSFD
jgi:hypothetical protein